MPFNRSSTSPLEKCWLFVAALSLNLNLLSLALTHEEDPDSVHENDLLPDLIVIEEYLYDTKVKTDSEGRRLLLLATATANIGQGDLRVEGSRKEDHDDHSPHGDPADHDHHDDHHVGDEEESLHELVEQVITQSDGSHRRRTAGAFEFHPEHLHVHVEAWAEYRLRARLADGQPGEVLATGGKTSFCLVDLLVHDTDLPHFSKKPTFTTCQSNVQGISVGWADFYHRDLPDQNIDVTDIPDGIYWLEVEVDPNHSFLEEDEENNIARALVSIGDSLLLQRDTYEPNETFTIVDRRLTGIQNSPNLGPCNPSIRLPGMSLHEAADVDIYKFYVNGNGSEEDFVHLEFDSNETRLELELFDSQEDSIQKKVSETGELWMSLKDLDKGWYYVKILSPDGKVCEDYSLKISPPKQTTNPFINILNPAVGDRSRRHSIENYRVTWEAQDPEEDELWVDVYINTQPQLDGNEFMIPGSRAIRGELGFHILHSASIAPGTYWVYCRIKDGGSTSGAWSEGSVTFEPEPIFVRGDCDGDGRVLGRLTDAYYMLRFNFIGDVNPPCFSACDANGDGVFFGDISDPVYLLYHNFLGGPAPPAPFFHCGFGLLETDQELGCEQSTTSCP